MRRHGYSHYFTGVEAVSEELFVHNHTASKWSSLSSDWSNSEASGLMIILFGERGSEKGRGMLKIIMWQDPGF